MLILLSIYIFSFASRTQVSSSQGTPYFFTHDEIGVLLEEHNRYRASEPAANMQELVWNEQLAFIAQDWATKCIGDHRPNRTSKAGFVAIGENLWWTNSHVLWKDLRRVIQDFYVEKYIYDFSTGYCPTGMLCGHYTQLVWADTCSVGCAASFCPFFYKGRGIKSGVMVACNYGPAGNYIGQKPYVYGKPCQACPETCINNLCPSQCSGSSRVKRLLKPINFPHQGNDKWEGKNPHDDKEFDVAERRTNSITIEPNGTAKIQILQSTTASRHGSGEVHWARKERVDRSRKECDPNRPNCSRCQSPFVHQYYH